MRPTLADRLTAARRRALIGRDDELDRAAEFLDDTSSAVVLHVHGPGGVGKTTLLRAVEDLALERDRTTRRIDLAELAVTRESVVEAVVGEPAADLETLPGGTVVLIDHAEQLGVLETWVWRTLLPSVPEDCRVVVASRRPPPPDVREPGWSDLLRVIALRNLPPDQSARLLRSCGVPDAADVTSLVRVTHGHPLALVIAADEYAARVRDDGPAPEASALLDHPDAAARLLGSFVDDVAEPLQRQALHVIGHARRVDRAMLMAVLEVGESGADDLLEWLRVRPYAQSHPDGLSVHDVVRDALDRDLRWRDRDAFATLHRGIRSVILDRMARSHGGDHARAVADLLFLHRGNPDAQDLYGFDDLLALTHRRARPEDRDDVIASFRRADGPERASHVAAWFDAHPEMFRVMEDGAGEHAGAVAGLRLDLVEVTGDPLVSAVRSELARRRPAGTGEPTLLNLVADPRTPDLLGGFSDQMAAISLREWTLPQLGWVVVASTRAATWRPLWEYIGFEELGEHRDRDHVVGFFGRDFARSDYASWLDALLLRELDRDGTAPPPVSTPVALAREDFELAVREVLRDYGRPERLRPSALLRSRLVGSGTDPVAALRAAIRASVEVVGRQARGDLPARAVDRTYLRPAASQELAAEVLGVPFGTYRRHLRSGVARVADVLWDWELHGVPEREVDRN